MTDLAEVVDADVVGTELEHVEHAPPPSLFRTDDPVEVLDKASTVATALARVIDQQGMFVNIRGKNYVTVDGWQTLGSMLGVTAVVVSTREVADGDWEARAEARTLDGRVVGAADAMCLKAEGGNWGPKATSNARRAMAQTRAMSRALRGPLGFVVNLAGYAATAAEEMPVGPPVEPEVQQNADWIETGRSERIEASVKAAIKDGLLDAQKFKLACQSMNVGGRSVRQACQQMTPGQADKIESLLADLRAAAE
jgi:hypothetical protein